MKPHCSTSLRQFTAKIDDEDESEDEERHTFEVFDAVAAQIIKVKNEDETEEGDRPVSLQMPTLNINNECASLTALLQDAVFEYALTEGFRHYFGSVFRNIFVKNGAIKWSTSRQTQCINFCLVACQMYYIASWRATSRGFDVGLTASKGDSTTYFSKCCTWTCV